MTDPRIDDHDEVLIEEEILVVEERPVEPIDRRDVLEGVVPELTPEPQSTPRPDFARGQEADPLRLEGLVEDRFSRGQEDDPTLHEQVHEGDFATGQSERPRHPETKLEGRFARGGQEVDPDSPQRRDLDDRTDR